MKILPPPEITPQIEARFWRLVRKGDGPDDCWEWISGRWKHTGGARKGEPSYGIFKIKVGRKWQRFKAHRIAYLIVCGRFPDDLACHRCDNEGCVRPDHLFDGTPAANSADMVAKGRQIKGSSVPPERRARGSRSAHAKLTEAQVADLLIRYQAGESIPRIAASLGMSRCTIWEIIRGKNWIHVERPADLQPPTIARGERQGSAKLTADQVREIRRRYDAGESRRDIAIAFGLHTVYVSNIGLRKTWAWLPEGGPSTAA